MLPEPGAVSGSGGNLLPSNRHGFTIIGSAIRGAV